jgi:hypothetical protein
MDTSFLSTLIIVGGIIGYLVWFSKGKSGKALSNATEKSAGALEETMGAVLYKAKEMGVDSQTQLLIKENMLRMLQQNPEKLNELSEKQMALIFKDLEEAYRDFLKDNQSVSTADWNQTATSATPKADQV